MLLFTLMSLVLQKDHSVESKPWYDEFGFRIDSEGEKCFFMFIFPRPARIPMSAESKPHVTFCLEWLVFPRMV